MSKFLPISKEDMEERGWTYVDFVYVSGDAYVDQPSFGTAIITRVLENRGYKVAVLAQPKWDTEEDFKRFGKPRLGFLISSGNIDSMVNNYTVAKKRRRRDVYAPNGKLGYKPDRAVIVYANATRKAYKDTAIIIGGLEASLRRLGHYDYWDNRVRRSILLDSKADLLLYGMGENSIIEVAEALDSGIPIEEVTYVRGSVYKAKNLDSVYDYEILSKFSEIKNNKRKYAENFMIQYKNTDAVTAKTLVEPYDNFYVVQNPPTFPLTQSEMDYVYSLPYMRNYHPIYESMGGIPAIEEVKFSLISNRGCFGSCSFCALAFHQGRVLQVRSHQSIINEANKLIWDPDFKGYIHDVGGPTANFRHTACEKQIEKGVCKDRQCLFPTPCKQLKIDHSDYLALLRKLRELPNVKKVFVRSGIRYDYLIYDKDDTFFYELCKYHISGQLKVAPEHISPKVLNKMGKPHKEVYEKFVAKYKKINEELGMKQYLVPYLISSHPGSDLNAAIQLAEYLRDIRYTPEQVQDFYPTPGTLSTCMYYTEIDPRTMEKVYIPKSPHEKAVQRALIQYKKPQNYKLVLEALIKANRQDLIGYDKKCLIRPPKNKVIPGIKSSTQNKDKKKKKKTIRNVHKKKK